MLIGYIRPLQDDLNGEIQQATLEKLKCNLIIKEEHSSAKKRVKLKKMINGLNKGDKIIVTKLSVLADSTRHLVDLLESMNMKEAYLYSLKEKVDTSTASGSLFKDTVKHLVDFQSDVISEKTKKGLSEAKQKGIIAGRPRKSDENVDRAIAMYQSKKYTLAEIKEATGISKSTLYRYLEQ
ncbi:recombinase family protein [Bacillus tuaregi]|uniref:recombinase family protein n=1 Tax=Bacillus tuaregi TaxID=1816695 RepID=UPI0008F8057D|nr:recombinase family protein [Bacillus tuaregi]